MSLPVWREWKLLLSFFVSSFFLRLNEPSRLKGMETLQYHWHQTVFRAVWMSLPVWRELKREFNLELPCRPISVWMSLPVWRELKLSVDTHIFNCLCPVWMSLPVWRELKLTVSSISNSSVVASEWAFPFEGNWNSFKCRSALSLKTPVWMSLPVWRESKLLCLYPFFYSAVIGLNVPSRLKGMETNVDLHRARRLTCLNVPSRLKGIETTEPSQSQAWCDTFDALSRLKGIETFRNSPATSESRMTQKNADFQTSVCPVLTALFGMLHGKLKKDWQNVRNSGILIATNAIRWSESDVR